MMEGSSADNFPGFQTCTHRDEFEFRKSLSRLQQRAPRPIQIKTTTPSSGCNGGQNSIGCNSKSCSSTSSSMNSFFSKDPIPLLSPLVLPLVESTCTREENTAKSH
ncbi:hypothetical protein O6P43_032875 [Quillaja saponaria]|uniref:Uncharacterized protein n=1 Tax=Quillaja saponaria TaxID=32244 RepID=A0AAD7KQX7_QUISA|nr:hypothetical protein O6P43_032875 [Quillaja saponaria]